ncbi:MAG: CheR family methyltransferase [Janthinobacterium lividum]
MTGNDTGADAASTSPAAAPASSTAGAQPDFPVVGIGASAGGVPAILRFFESAPADMGMAFAVILHLSPKYESHADEVIQKVTRMPVIQVTRETQIQKNHVYVISPSTNLSMDDGHFRVVSAERPHGRPVAIDVFFCSLAEAHKERAICIVLSGSGSDGAVGIGRIKEEAGITLAQTPADAEYAEMPESAIATGMVDLVLPVVDMPQKLLELWQNARAIRLPPGADAPSTVAQQATASDEQALRSILRLLRERTGHDFAHYKRATVLRRIERRLQVNALNNLEAYEGFLTANVAEAPALLRDMLIGVTNFFRDRISFESLERDTIPKLFEDKGADDQIRIWCAGCSTGEEAFSLAMLVAEHGEGRSDVPSLQVFATDIDERAIRVGRVGAFPTSILTDVPPRLLNKFFTKDQLRYRINKGLRGKLLFAIHNVLRDPPFSRLDLVSCRNLLIYLDRSVQRQVLQMFHFALRPGGFLFLGNSESAEVAEDLFLPVDKKNRIYRAKVLSHSGREPVIVAMKNIALATLTAPAVETLPNRHAFSFGALHQRVLEQYAPPSVIVDRASNVVHMSDHAGRFLRYVGGEPSQNLIEIVQPELRLELRTALFQAMESGKSIEARRVRFSRDGNAMYVNMTVRPFRDAAADADFVLVLFDEVEDTMKENSADPSELTRDPVLVQLENELQTTKLRLQETVEQADTSTEELKASNEELQAINEELRSATEELETSKEELQSTNEELVTVNAELQTKIEETGKANDDLLNLITSTEIATVFVDRALRIKRYTPKAVELFNVIASDIGRSLLDITHHLEYPQLAEDVTAAFESLKLIEREIGGAHGRWYLARHSPYRTTDDRIDGAVLTLIDITARRAAEAQARQSEERLQLVAQSTNDYAIIVQDTAGLIVSWNQGAERIFGHLEHEVVGQPIDLIFLPEDRANGVPIHERQRVQEDGRAEDERWHIRKDGSRLYCSGVMTPLQGVDFKGFAKICRDLTDKKSAESAQLMQLSLERAVREQVEAANRLKDEFLAVLSHELKNPLNLIHVKAEMLTRLPEARHLPAIQNAAAAIRRSVIGQAKIIDDLLDLSRVRTGKLMLNHAQTDVAAIVHTAAEAVVADAAQRGIRLSLHGASEPLLISADAVRVEQIVWNLLSNALKFTPSGGAIRLSCTREGPFAYIEVADTGQGIEPKFLPKIFDMFSQAEGGISRQRGGLGIGLALVKQLSEMHGGRASAESAGLGQGATFRIWLPIDAGMALLDNPGPPAETGVLKGVRILVVDDMVDALEAFRTLLEIEGADVHAETNGQDAIQATLTHDFDLILSDIGMPGMDGYELIAALRQMPRTAKIPAIAISGFGRPQDAAHALQAGFNGHLSKPVSLHSLLQMIHRSFIYVSGIERAGLRGD